MPHGQDSLADGESSFNENGQNPRGPQHQKFIAAKKFLLFERPSEDCFFQSRIGSFTRDCFFQATALAEDVRARLKIQSILTFSSEMVISSEWEKIENQAFGSMTP